MKFFTHNLSLYFNKKCQNFQTKNKLKELILAKISDIPQISQITFNLVAGLKLQCQWKSISLLRGFSLSVQCVIPSKVVYIWGNNC